MDLSIIIVHYKTPQMLSECIRSIYEQTHDIDFEIIVVDNHSQDKTKEILNQEFSSVRFFEMGYNSGFARANNKGISEAKSDNLLLLNSDTIILDRAINKSFNQFRIEPNSIGVFACKLLNSDGSHQNSIYYKNASFTEVLGYNPFYSALKRRFFTEKSSKNEQIEALSGAFLLLRKSDLKHIGNFDSDFFMYAEEFELCKRFTKNGFQLVYSEIAEIIHLGGASESNQTRSLRQRQISVFLLFLKVHGPFGLILYLILMKMNVFSQLFFWPFVNKETKYKIKDDFRTFLELLPYFFEILFNYSEKQGNGSKLLKYEFR